MAFAAIASKRGALAEMDKPAINIAEALARLSALTIFELRGEWRRLHRMPPPMRLSRDLLIRGIIYKLQERAYADALTKAGEIEERLGNDRGQAMVLNSLGGVLQRLGKFPEAADALERSTRNVSRSTMRQGLGAC